MNSSFDAVFLLGPHAMAGATRAVLSHGFMPLLTCSVRRRGRWLCRCCCLDLRAFQTADWHEQLRQSREETYRFLDELRASSDRVRLRNGDETWTVRKVLRRLVWHERLHLKSIRRIVADYGRTHG